MKSGGALKGISTFLLLYIHFSRLPSVMLHARTNEEIIVMSSLQLFSQTETLDSFFLDSA